MSSIHYKFKAALEYKTLTFDGLHISVEELKRLICEKENIRIESFDLVLTNAHTKREYSDEEVVPRNSSVIVQRLPKENAAKLPKIHDTNTSGIVNRSSNSGFGMPQSSFSYIEPIAFSKMTEEQRLAHVKEVSYQKYLPSNYQKKPVNSIMAGPPPPTYICNRCNNPGHWYKNCPLLAQKLSKGIPMEELMETTRDNPNAMLHPSGKFVVPIMHHQARLQRKHEPFPGTVSGQVPLDIVENEAAAIPAELTCGACNGLLRNAVLATCCGESFCDECIQQKLLSESRRCPGKDCTELLSTDSIAPNKGMRETVQRYLCLLAGVDMSQMKGTDSIQQFGANKPDIMNTNRSFAYQPPIQQTQQTNQTTVQHIPISSPSTIYNLVQPVVTDVEKSKQNISQAASSVTSASTFQPFSQFSVPPPQISTQGNFQPLTTHASAQGQHRIFHPQAIDTKQQPSTPTTPTLHIPKFDPHMPPPPIPTSRVSNILASTSTFDTQTQQTVTVTNPLGSGTGFSTGVSTTDNNSPNVPASFSSTSQNSAQISDDRNNAWESFLKRNDTYSDNNLPTVLNLSSLGSVSHQQQSASSSHEISDKWESFLRQKDREKKLHQANNSSTTTSSDERSGRSSSRSSSSPEIKERSRRRSSSRRGKQRKLSRSSSYRDHSHERGTSSQMEAAFRALTRRGGFYRGRGGKYHGGSNPRRDFRPKNYLSPIRDGHHQSEHKSQHSENMNHREERVKETSHNKRRRRRSSSSDERRATEAKREKSECDKAKDVRKAKPKSDKSSKVEKSKPKDDKAHDKMQVLNRSKEFLGDKEPDKRVSADSLNIFEKNEEAEIERIIQEAESIKRKESKTTVENDVIQPKQQLVLQKPKHVLEDNGDSKVNSPVVTTPKVKNQLEPITSASKWKLFNHVQYAEDDIPSTPAFGSHMETAEIVTSEAPPEKTPKQKDKKRKKDKKEEVRDSHKAKETEKDSITKPIEKKKKDKREKNDTPKISDDKKRSKKSDKEKEKDGKVKTEKNAEVKTKSTKESSEQKHSSEKRKTSKTPGEKEKKSSTKDKDEKRNHPKSSTNKNDEDPKKKKSKERDQKRKSSDHGIKSENPVIKERDQKRKSSDHHQRPATPPSQKRMYFVKNELDISSIP